mgnify:CR=1 FL=1
MNRKIKVRKTHVWKKYMRFWMIILMVKMET